jgi:hypothetical protein
MLGSGPARSRGRIELPPTTKFFGMAFGIVFGLSPAPEVTTMVSQDSRGCFGEQGVYAFFHL